MPSNVAKLQKPLNVAICCRVLFFLEKVFKCCRNLKCCKDFKEVEK